MSSDYPPPGYPPRTESIEPAQPYKPYKQRSHPTSRKLRPGMSRKEAVRGYYAIAQELAEAEAKIAELEAELKTHDEAAVTLARMNNLARPTEATP